MEEEMRSESVAEAGGRHWSVRPGAMFLFLLAARFLISALEVALSLSVNPQADGDVYVLVLGIGEIAVTLGVGIACYILMRRAQRLHGLPAEREWNAGKALWVGVALLVAYVTVAYFFDPRWSYMSRYFTLDYLSEFAVRLGDMLLFVLLLPLLETKRSLAVGAIVVGALAAAGSLLNRLVFAAASLLQSPILYEDISSILAAPALLSMVAAFAFGVLAALTYRLASRRLPGAWALYASLVGLFGLLGSVLSGLVDAGQMVIPLIYYVVYVAYYLVVALLAIGVLAGFNRWNSFSAFASDFKAGIIKLRGMQDDGEA